MINFRFFMNYKWILIILFLIIGGLVVIKMSLVRQNKKLKYDKESNIGNAQLIGMQDIQSDYFATVKQNGQLLAVVADGMSRKKIGKYSAVVGVEILKSNFKNYLKFESMNEYFNVSYHEIEKYLNDNLNGNMVGTMILAAVVKNNMIYWSSVGNCILYLFRKEELKCLNDTLKEEIQFGKYSIKKGDMFLLCTDGAYGSLSEGEITYELLKKLHPYHKALNLAKVIQSKNYSYQDNATIILLETN